MSVEVGLLFAESNNNIVIVGIGKEAELGRRIDKTSCFEDDCVDSPMLRRVG